MPWFPTDAHLPRLFRVPFPGDGEPSASPALVCVRRPGAGAEPAWFLVPAGAG